MSLLTRGHINRTFTLCAAGKTDPEYLLQQINTYVFGPPERLMHNMELVTATIREANLREGLDPDTHGINLLRTLSGASVFTDSQGLAWRMMKYIPDHRVYDVVSSDHVAREGGRAYGIFLRQLSVINPEELFEVIPGFHDLGLRLEQFDRALEAASAERKTDAEPEIRETRLQRDRFAGTVLYGEVNSLPLRVTHNDTKSNNVLFTRDDRALCVVDLDTVMKGRVHYDFGDAIRTAAASAREDIEDPAEMKFVFERFRAFSEGYLGVVAPILTKEEAGSLYLAPSYFAFIMGLRFLTDYLNGDKYFQILRKNHNLQRTRAQYALMKEMQKDEGRMRDTLAGLYEKYTGLATG